MSSFKDKPLKKCHTDKRIMIDDLHHKLIKTMEEDEKTTYYLDNGLLLDQYYRDTGSKQTVKNEGILNYFKNNEIENDKSESGKKCLINEYMCNIDDTIINSKYQDYSIDKCMHCQENLLYKNNDSIIFCASCGYTEDIMIVIDF